MLRLSPLELNLSSELDMACIKLVERADFLQKFMQIKDGKIMFTDQVTVGQAMTMMLYAKQNYFPFNRSEASHD